jgi:hypothetical protein
MRFTVARDTEAASLCDELAARAMETDAPGLMTANLWLWDVEPANSTSDPRAVVVALLGHTSIPCRALLEPRAALGPWVSPAPEAARAAAVRLLTFGASLEVAAFHDEQQVAARFADRLLGWVGSPVAALVNIDHRPDGSAAGFGVFRVPQWVDEGLVLVGPERVGLLWFVGTD